MKCFVVLIVICIIGEGFTQQINSLSAMSLISPQMNFLEDICLNRAKNVNVFKELKETLDECQSMILEGTNLTQLTYDTLVHKDPKEFYDFYTSQCTEPSAIDLRTECNDNLKYLLKQCLNETELLAFNKIEDIALRIYGVICDMDQEKMKHFFSAKGQECLSDNVITIGYCFLSAMPDDDEEKQEFLFKLMEGKECKVIDAIENCMMGELEICEEKSISNIFKLLFDFFKQELNCSLDEEVKQDESLNSQTATKASSYFSLTSFFIALLFFND